MSETAAVVVIGSRTDPHVAAVLSHLTRSSVLVTDAAAIAETRYVLRSGSLVVEDAGRTQTLDIGRPARGWIRRLAPPDWHRGLQLESHDAAVKTSWLTLMTGILRNCGVRWLSDIDSLVVGESKLVQGAAAERIAVRTPTTLVTNDPNAVVDAIGSEVVLKPLGPGHYFEGTEPYAIYATAVAANGPELSALGSAPFLAQERLRAQRHLRIVTVTDQVWAAELDATDRPLDWRIDPPAHDAFSPIPVPSEIATGALAIAAELHLGYTSQDWIVTADDAYLLDVNPAGQWLFLPAAVSDAVTASIAAWLSEVAP